MDLKFNEKNLHSHVDIYGNKIQIGSVVRSYDFPTPLKGSNKPVGMEDKNSWVEGIVEAIGEDCIEGCPRYRIDVRLGFAGEYTHYEPRTSYVYPPLNGTPTIQGVTAGVVSEDLLDEWDNSGNTYYLQMPSFDIKSIGSEERDMAIITQEKNRYFLTFEGLLGGNYYSSLQDAKYAGLWKQKEMQIRQPAELVKDAGLPGDWHFDFSKNEFTKNDDNLSVYFNSTKNEWIAELDGRESNPFPTPFEAYNDLRIKRVA